MKNIRTTRWKCRFVKRKNKKKVPKALIRFLEFVHANLEDSTGDFEDEFVKKLQKSVARIKASREMGARYMVFEEMLKDEYADGKKDGHAEGKAECILELLEDFGEIPEDISERVMQIKASDVLKQLFKAARRAKSLDEFVTRMDGITKQE